MAKDKKSFLLYCDIIHTVNKLTDEQAGNLFKHILSYVNDENPTTDNIITELTFEPIKQALKRDLQKWESELDNKSLGGRYGNLKRWHKDLYDNVLSKQITIEQAEEIAKRRIVSDTDKNNRIVSDSIGSIAVSDSVSVIDSVIVKDIKYKNILLSEIKISDVRESDLKYYEIAKNFYELFKSNLIELGSVTNQIEKTKATWIDDLRLIIEKDNYTIEDLRKVYNFLKTEKPNANGFSWKKNILSISKLREQMPKLLIESNKNNVLAQEQKRVLPERLDISGYEYIPAN